MKGSSRDRQTDRQTDSVRPPSGRPERSSPRFVLGLELQDQQSRLQDASCLPALKVSDIEPTMSFTELEVALAGQSLGMVSAGGATCE